MGWPTVSAGRDLKHLVEGRIGRLHAEVGREDEQRFPDRLDNLGRHLLGRVEVRHLPAQGGQFLVDRPRWGRSVFHRRCSSLEQSRRVCVRERTKVAV